MFGSNYMLMNVESGNAIDGWDNYEEAATFLLEILWYEPESRDSIILIEFDQEGMATRIIWPPTKD